MQELDILKIYKTSTDL